MIETEALVDYVVYNEVGEYILHGSNASTVITKVLQADSKGASSRVNGIALLLLDCTKDRERKGHVQRCSETKLLQSQVGLDSTAVNSDSLFKEPVVVTHDVVLQRTLSTSVSVANTGKTDDYVLEMAVSDSVLTQESLLYQQ